MTAESKVELTRLGGRRQPLQVTSETPGQAQDWHRRQADEEHPDFHRDAGNDLRSIVLDRFQRAANDRLQRRHRRTPAPPLSDASER